MKTIKSLLAIVIFGGLLSAQGDEFDSKYYNETIYLQQGFLGPKYMMGGNSYLLVTIGGELKRYTDSGELYRKYKFMRLVSLGLFYAGPILSVGMTGPGGGEDLRDTYMSLFIGSIFLGALAQIESINKLNEAVWVYNGNQLKKKEFGKRVPNK
ncbi:MAG: hypothetical protein ACKVJJ_01785 [Fidelibacterota bacterium]|jgi:hypothetical protein